MPKEVSGHCNGKVKSIPKADRGIGKRVSHIILKMSGKFILTTVSKITRPVRLKSRLEIGQ